jgi:hypothetical protein
MTPDMSDFRVVEATPLDDLDALVRGRNAYRDLVDDHVVMAVERALAAGASWSQIAEVIHGSDHPMMPTSQGGPLEVSA